MLVRLVPYISILQILQWFDTLSQSADEPLIIGEDLIACKRQLESWSSKMSATHEATQTATSEGQQLIQSLR